MPLCKTIPSQAQAESNVRDGLYGSDRHVVDCWLVRPKFNL
jgi:hypothetical protein